MSYSVVDALFRQHEGALSAAEAHGIATGMLCVDLRGDCSVWLNEVLGDSETLDDSAHTVLSMLFERTRHLLQDDDYAFDLFLPGDEESLQYQAEALRDWCQGFLLGIGYSGSQGNWPGEQGEIVRDIVEISRLETDAAGEDDENAFTQIHEYLRAAVLLIRQELNGENASHTPH
jgi:uncharacterized protein YgfB (UPF0149 family)